MVHPPWRRVGVRGRVLVYFDKYGIINTIKNYELKIKND